LSNYDLPQTQIGICNLYGPNSVLAMIKSETVH